MPPYLHLPLQDTTIVTVARDGIGTVSAWMTVGLGVAFVAILIVLFLVLAELRRLSRTWTDFLTTTGERTIPLVEHANSAVRNLDRITRVVRSEVDRFDGALVGVTEDIGKVSADVKRRAADLSALLDLAQSEAEDAVLDAAAPVRTLRKGAALVRGAGAAMPAEGAAPATGTAPAKGAPPATEARPATPANGDEPAAQPD